MELISWMVAPQASRAPVTACLSARVRAPPGPLQGEGQKGRAAAGDQADDEGPLVGRPRQLCDAPSGEDALVVGEGMARLDGLDAGEGGRVAVLDGDQPPRDPLPENPLQPLGHGGRRLARPEDEDAVIIVEIDLEETLPQIDGEEASRKGEAGGHHPQGVDPGQPGAKDLLEMLEFPRLRHPGSSWGLRALSRAWLARTRGWSARDAARAK